MDLKEEEEEKEAHVDNSLGQHILGWDSPCRSPFEDDHLVIEPDRCP